MLNYLMIEILGRLPITDLVVIGNDKKIFVNTVDTVMNPHITNSLFGS